MTVDLISDCLTRMKNAGSAGRQTFIVPATKMTRAVVSLLDKKSFVAGFEEKEIKGYPHLVVSVSYENNKPKVKGVKRISKSSRRQYQKVAEISEVKQGYGIVVLSTPQGLMTGDEAKETNVGGEVLFEIW